MSEDRPVSIDTMMVSAIKLRHERHSGDGGDTTFAHADRGYLLDALDEAWAERDAARDLANEMGKALRLVMTCDQDKPDQLLPAVDAGWDALIKWEAGQP